MEYTLKLGSSMTTVMLAVVFGFALIGIIIWSNVVKNIGIMNVFRLGFIIMTVGFIPLFFAKKCSLPPL